MRLEQRHQTDGRAIDSWRRHQLLQSGFAPALARRIADDPAYDLHALIELVEHGCPPELAVRILAPLEYPRSA
jgi:Mn-dependent DtxR family transcriptional regulator